MQARVGATSGSAPRRAKPPRCAACAALAPEGQPCHGVAAKQRRAGGLAARHVCQRSALKRVRITSIAAGGQVRRRRARRRAPCLVSSTGLSPVRGAERVWSARLYRTTHTARRPASCGIRDTLPHIPMHRTRHAARTSPSAPRAAVPPTASGEGGGSRSARARPRGALRAQATRGRAREREPDSSIPRAQTRPPPAARRAAHPLVVRQVGAKDWPGNWQQPSTHFISHPRSHDARAGDLARAPSPPLRTAPGPCGARCGAQRLSRTLPAAGRARVAPACCCSRGTRRRVRFAQQAKPAVVALRRPEGGVTGASPARGTAGTALSPQTRRR